MTYREKGTARSSTPVVSSIFSTGGVRAPDWSCDMLADVADYRWGGYRGETMIDIDIEEDHDVASRHVARGYPSFASNDD